ncbi:4-phosphoerythronate dehydrogenase PdxB [Dysgonomonas sp. 520]|uniref:4-phosphoerythronate dehydrogenase PdxB n=1 Tax=Dysgonomonas sp. 520 TaxID=2302931 RepID=UPI0013D1CBC6|nr:4-phosphoerythronate dehydrogenase PdxB [Dysgonomonas sp. 520]NDW08523.1 4-phosphoerythronate dehydrogenase PdxB [Dysgonomonas sp. 520]
MKIVADKNIPYLKGIAEHYGDVTYLSGNEFTKESIKNADILIVRTVTYFGREILEGSRVKLICSATIGYDHIDTDYCDRNGIKWTNAPGCNSASVQQYIVSALIQISRKKRISLKGKTIGIVGVGNVGSKVAKACEILGMKVLLNDPPRQEAEKSKIFVELEKIQQEADIITFHTPLNKTGEYKTLHLADKDFFLGLKKQPIIINSARGGIIDTNAVKESIKSGIISASVVDCWENEPDIDIEYMNMADIATPHIAGYSADGKGNATRMSLEVIADLCNLPRTPIYSIKVPDPENLVIDLNAFRAENRVYEAILKTYNPEDDCLLLRENPRNFTKLRGSYPLRREYPAYRVINETPDEKEILSQLGFITN